MDIVLDTNVMISGLLWKGTPSKILKQCKTGKHTNFISPPIIHELKNVLSYDKFELNEEEIADAIGLILSLSKVVVPDIKLKIITDDMQDNIFLECAKYSGVKCIISGDSHLLNLRVYDDVKILNCADFLKLINPKKT